jgi:microcystin-dependent protein
VAEPFLSEIRIMSFNFPPKGWALCDGQLLPINQNQALFSLLGTTYGGDGRVNFALPDLRARAPIHVGGGHTLGERGGETAHTISIAEMPQHLHAVNGNSASTGTTNNPTNNVLASPLNQIYRAPDNSLTTLRPDSVTSVGGSQAHVNAQPSLVLSFCIALAGIFPSQT